MIQVNIYSYCNFKSVPITRSQAKKNTELAKFVVSKTNSSIICRSIDQGETLKSETTYINKEDISLFSSTLILENTVEERTKINSLQN